MLNDYTVDVVLKDKLGKTIAVKDVPFDKFCRSEMRNVITVLNDIETFFVEQFGRKEEWSDEQKSAFYIFRRLLLNVANSFERLPSMLRYKGKKINTVPLAEAVAEDFDAVANGKNSALINAF